MATSQTELFERVTQHIIRSIEAGAGAFQMPWHARSGTSSLPRNPVGHYAYHGINTLCLWARQQAEGYSSGEWASYRQWQSAGAQVRKGETGTLTLLFKPIELRAQEGESVSTDKGESGCRRPFIARAGVVFNADQVDGYSAERPVDEGRVHVPHEDAEALIRASGACIRLGGDQACYLPRLDEIRLPLPSAFVSQDAYYGVAFHELTHWTGHVDRCARDLSGRFGSEAYAMEELVAELGAAFLCAEVGVSAEPRIDHAQYLTSWLRVFKSDPKALITASGKASQAARFLTDRAQGTHTSSLRVVV